MLSAGRGSLPWWMHGEIRRAVCGHIDCQLVLKCEFYFLPAAVAHHTPARQPEASGAVLFSGHGLRLLGDPPASCTDVSNVPHRLVYAHLYELVMKLPWPRGYKGSKRGSTMKSTIAHAHM